MKKSEVSDNKLKVFENKIFYLNNAVVKSRKMFSMTEHRLFRLALCDLRPQFKNMKKTYSPDEEFREFFINTEELLKIFTANNNSGKVYENIKEACNNLVRTSIELGTLENFVVFPMFDYISFDISQGLKLKFHSRLKTVLLGLESGNYTKSFLRLSFDLNHPRALTLLEMLLTDAWKAKERCITKEISVDELRFAFNVKANAYNGRMNTFRQLILNPAIQEINDRTNYIVKPDYEVKYGRYRKILAFKFTLILPSKESDVLDFKKDDNTLNADVAPCVDVVSDVPSVENSLDKSLPSVIDYSEEEKEIIVTLQNYGIKRTVAEDLLKNYSVKSLQEAVNIYKKRSRYSPINSPSGFIFTTIKNFCLTKDEEAKEDIYKQEIEQKKAEERERERLETERLEVEKLKAENERQARIKERVNLSSDDLDFLVADYKAHNQQFSDEAVLFLVGKKWTPTEVKAKYFSLFI